MDLEIFGQTGEAGGWRMEDRDQGLGIRDFGAWGLGIRD